MCLSKFFSSNFNVLLSDEPCLNRVVSSFSSRFTVVSLILKVSNLYSKSKVDFISSNVDFRLFGLGGRLLQ